MENDRTHRRHWQALGEANAATGASGTDTSLHWRGRQSKSRSRRTRGADPGRPARGRAVTQTTFPLNTAAPRARQADQCWRSGRSTSPGDDPPNSTTASCLSGISAPARCAAQITGIAAAEPGRSSRRRRSCAQALLEQAVALAPQSVWAHARLAPERPLVRQNRLDEARAQLFDAMMRCPPPATERVDALPGPRCCRPS